MKKVILYVIISVFVTLAIYFASQAAFGLISESVAQVLLSAATFLFGIFIAFSISNAHQRMDAIFETLNTHNASLLYIYNISQVFDAKTKNAIQKRIDAYLIATIDYLITDMKFSYPEFQALFKHLLNISPKNEKQRKVWEQYLDLYDTMVHSRKKVEVTSRAKLLAHEWFIISLLLAIITFFILYLSSGTLISVMASFLLVIAIVVLVMLLQNLNSLSWKEQHRIWRPIHQLFKELDLLPYYPAPVVLNGRAQPKKGERIRLAYYNADYPDVSKKDIKEVAM